MSAPEPDPRASIAGLSDAGEPAGTPAGEVPAPRERYREVEVVGSGGLGTVLLAHDELLARDVALKRIGPRADDATAHEQFLREARITARLDHPGIVPIHDAGFTDDGRLFYTMRLIRGRTLGVIAAEAPDLEARLTLVGSVIAACHAVGYAHRKQIIHRDLKPSNIMIGDLGETQVVDWGLAEDLADGVPTASLAGTVAYTSPEVARGEPPSIASDVWALGAVLHEVVGGAVRFTGSRDDVLAALRAGPSPARWPEGCPPELAAIGDRAMSRDPAARYEDAQALALDLEAYRDGRRVRAHSYSTLALVRRAVVALRWPLALGGVAITGTIVALAITAHRTEAQRERAVAAEARTRAELGRTEAALADALAANATAALDQELVANAERSAMDALAHGERPDARGVLAATRAVTPLQLRDARVVPGCPRVIPAADGAICLGAGFVARWSGDPLAERWRTPLVVEGAAAVGPGVVAGWTRAGEVILLDARTGAITHRDAALAGVVASASSPGGDRVVLHDGRDVVAVIADGTLDGNTRPCGVREIAAIASSASTTWLVCAGGDLGRVGPRGFERIDASQFGSEVPPATALGVSDHDDAIVLGGALGDVFRYGACVPDTCRADRLSHEIRSSVRGLAVVGRDTIAQFDRGDAVVFRAGVAAEIARAPLAEGPMLVAANGEVVTGGSAYRRWQVPSAAEPARFVHLNGLVTASIAPDGAIAAGLSSDGEVVVWNLRTGALVRGFSVGELGHVTALSTDGATLWIATSDRGDRAFDLAAARWSETARAPAPAPARCTVTWTTHRIDASCGERRQTIALDELDLTAAAISDDGTRIAAGTSTGVVLGWDQTGRLVARATGHAQRVSWLAFRGGRLWSAGWDGALRWWDTEAWTASVDRLRSDAERRWGAAP